MKRRQDAAAGTAVGSSAHDEGFARKYPTLWEHLSMLTFEDGSPREPSKISLFVENGTCKAALNDVEEKASLYVAADTLEGALKALEKAASSPSAEWRPWSKGKRK